MKIGTIHQQICKSKVKKHEITRIILMFPIISSIIVFGGFYHTSFRSLGMFLIPIGVFVGIASTLLLLYIQAYLNMIYQHPREDYAK